jgi:TadE-like protein
MRRNHRRRGQSLIEFAIALPVLVLLMFGIVDLARVFYLDIQMAGAARAGARYAIQADVTDIGTNVRNEPANAIPNDQSTWGRSGPGASYDNCTTPGGACGDPGGCTLSDGNWTSSQLACFAIRKCTLNASSGDSGSCSTYGAWGTRPADGSAPLGARGFEVLVVYRFAPESAAIQKFAGGPQLALIQTAFVHVDYTVPSNK